MNIKELRVRRSDRSKRHSVRLGRQLWRLRHHSARLVRRSVQRGLRNEQLVPHSGQREQLHNEYHGGQRFDERIQSDLHIHCPGYRPEQWQRQLQMRRSKHKGITKLTPWTLNTALFWFQHFPKTYFREHFCFVWFFCWTVMCDWHLLIWECVLYERTFLRGAGRWGAESAFGVRPRCYQGRFALSSRLLFYLYNRINLMLYHIIIPNITIAL